MYDNVVGWVMLAPIYSFFVVYVTVRAGWTDRMFVFYKGGMTQIMRIVIVICTQVANVAIIGMLVMAYGTQAVIDTIGEWKTTPYGVIVILGTFAALVTPHLGICATVAIIRRPVVRFDNPQAAFYTTDQTRMRLFGQAPTEYTLHHRQ